MYITTMQAIENKRLSGKKMISKISPKISHELTQQSPDFIVMSEFVLTAQKASVATAAEVIPAAIATIYR